MRKVTSWAKSRLEIFLSKINGNNGNGLLRVLLASSISSVIALFIGATIYITTFGLVSPVSIYNQYSDRVLSSWPEGLVLEFKDGKMSKNIAGPVYMGDVSKLNSKKTSDSRNMNTNYDEFNIYKNKEPKYILAIDETKSASLEDFKSVDSAVLFAKDGIIGRKSSGEVNSYAYNFDKTIDKEVLMGWADKLSAYVWPVIIGVVIFSMVMYIPFKFTITLIWNCVLALILLLVAKVNNKKIAFEKLWKVANYLALPAILVATLLNFTYLYTFIVLGAATYLIIKNKLKD